MMLHHTCMEYLHAAQVAKIIIIPGYNGLMRFYITEITLSKYTLYVRWEYPVAQ